MPSPISRDETRAFAFALHDLLRRHQFQDVDRVCEFGVTLTECHALEVVAQSGPLSVNTVAARLGVNKSTASRALAALEEKKLVRRGIEPGDGRVTTFTATGEGSRRARAILLQSAERIAGCLRGLSARERKAALELLRRLAADECCCP